MAIRRSTNAWRRDCSLGAGHGGLHLGSLLTLWWIFCYVLEKDYLLPVLDLFAAFWLSLADKLNDMGGSVETATGVPRHTFSTRISHGI